MNRREFIKTAALSLPGFSLASRTWAGSNSPAIADLSIDFLSQQVPLVHRAEWAPYNTKESLLRPSTTLDRITIHHDGNEVSQATGEDVVMRKIQGILDAHFKRQYGDIGYHLMVDYAGRVWEGRPLRFQGAHVSNENRGNIGVLMLGNFEHQEPSDEQVNSLNALVRGLTSHFSIPTDRVYGHRDLAHSNCPGQHLYPHLQALRTAMTPLPEPHA